MCEILCDSINGILNPFFEFIVRFSNEKELFSSKNPEESEINKVILS